MQGRSIRLFAALVGVMAVTSAWGAVRTVGVVTTLPDLADWTRQIGGSRVEVRSLLRGLENPHTYDPKVSDVRAVAESRVLVEVGLGLEEWVGGLVENARNRDLLVVVASEGVRRIEEAGGSRGELGHAHGNPHVWLDPENAVVMCRNIARGLEEADPAAGSYYRQRLDAYVARLDAAARRLRREAAGLTHRRFLSYHAAWPYFARGLGLEVAGVITPLPGQEPSARALVALVNRIRSEGIRVLVTEPQLSSKLPDLLSQETGIRVLTLSPILGASSAGSYLELLESNAQALISALRGPGP